MGRFLLPALRGTLVLLLAGAFFLPGARSAYAHEVHIVKPGETLSQIALRYNTTAAELRRLNSLSDEDFVWYGQRLVIHAEDAASTAPARRVIEDFLYYEVQPGDSLTGLARRYGVGLAQLVQLNGMSPAQRLFIGQIVKVPGATEQAIQPKRSRGQTHVVQRGEHLGTIAALYGVSTRAIVQANNLADPSRVLVGQSLRIPVVDGPAVDNGYHTHSEFPTYTERWIDVDLSEQRVVAYEGTTPVNSFIISSGRAGTPTVTGTFRIWAKVPIQDMSGGNRAAGDYYYLEDVQHVQYFFEDYAFHGTYWHNNFGTPMSRGCINMRNEDAKWLFDWASPHTNGAGWLMSSDTDPGTLVVVHQ